MNRTKIVFLGALYVLQLFSDTQIFAAQMPVNSKNIMPVCSNLKNILRKKLFSQIERRERLVTALCFSPDPFAASNADASFSGTPCDVFLTQNGYKFIGKHTGELIIVNMQKMSSDTIRIYKQSAISSLAVYGEIIVVGGCTSKFIHRWYISSCKKHDSIELDRPAMFLQVVDDLLFVIDIGGNLLILDWYSGAKLYARNIGVHGAISNVVTKTDIDGRVSEIVVMTSKSNYFIDISSFVSTNMNLNSLSVEQLAKEVSCC